MRLPDVLCYSALAYYTVKLPLKFATRVTLKIWDVAGRLARKYPKTTVCVVVVGTITKLMGWR